MSPQIPFRLIRQVRRRAGDVCEYCRLPQASQEARFTLTMCCHGRSTGQRNWKTSLWRVFTCSLRKSARTSAVDLKTGSIAALFNPRTEVWSDHFAFTSTWRIRGRKPTGRATIEALGMNRTAIVLIRRELVLLNRFP